MDYDANVPPGLQSMYGIESPCATDLLKLDTDEIKNLDDREFELYKIDNQKTSQYFIIIPIITSPLKK